MKLVIIGGTGTLGKELQKINPNHDYFGRDLDITNKEILFKKLDEINPDVILHLAAITDSNYVDSNLIDTIETNIIGTAYISKWCISNNKRLVYVSTDYVYDGELDIEHAEDEAVKPNNNYAISKLGGECSVKFVKSHCIVRTSFGTDKTKYKSAYKNLLTSKDYVDVIAPMIYNVIFSDIDGIINIGTDSKSVYDYANKRYKAKSDFLPKAKNFSLNTNRYKNIFIKQQSSMTSKCPITGDTNGFKYFSLGKMPLVNNLCSTRDEALSAKKYSLEVQYFTKSKLSCLTENVNPNMLFSEYMYKSGVVKAYADHCKEMYSFVDAILEFKDGDSVLDIGGNDGTLLKSFLEKNNKLNVLNVDASTNVAKISENRGIKTLNAFWGVETATKINRKFKLITSTNVFQHTAPIADYTEAVAMSLEDSGIWCLEFPYWKVSMETNQFDQIYHEHVYFYLVEPLKILFEKYGLEIIRIKKYEIHGGSLRLLIGKKGKWPVSSFVEEIINEEHCLTPDFYHSWGSKLETHIEKCKQLLQNIKKSGAKIVGFGAAAKGCIFLNTLKMDYNILDAVIDDTDLKQGKYIPGTGIQIVSRDYLKVNDVDYILILAHNFKDIIIESLKKEYKGKYLILLPEILIL